ncbi:hypothetical protein [Williamsia sp.]|uniref:glycoside hydrolase family 19 protein n=1 Tax=Williamsia sp. TaxID=1872085 RepID=UPI002F94D5D0
MDAATLRRAMQPSYIDNAKWDQFVDTFNEALIVAECTTVPRAAAFCAQVGHESAGLRLFRELDTWETPQWSWDRERYRGRGPIQLTWRSNYQAFGNWCKARGLVDDSNLFVDRPELVEQPRWGFLAAAFYWVAQRPQINSHADAGNFDAITYAVNGGYTNKSDRDERWNRCLALGEALLPEEEISMAAKDDIIGFIERYLGPVISDVKDIREQLTGSRDLVYVGEGADRRVDWKASFKGWKQLGQNADGSNKTFVDSLADARERVISLEATVADLEVAIAELKGKK